MKNINFKTLLAGAALIGGLTVKAQGLEGVIVEEYHTVTQADADFINAQGGDFEMPVGAKVYRVYVDMAPNYRFLNVFASPDNSNPVNIQTTTTFWNASNMTGASADFAPGLTRNLMRGVAFDSYITIHTTGRAGSTIQACTAFGGGSSANTQQVGVPRTADPNGNGTLCNSYPGITGTDGHIQNPFPSAVPNLTTNLSNAIDFAAVTADGSQLNFINDSWATLPAQFGVDPTGVNRVLVGQFTTAGVFSFQINVALSNPSNQIEEYVHSTAAAGQQVSSFLTFPQTCVPPQITSATSNSPICSGQTLNLNASATGTAPLSFTWTGTGTISNGGTANATVTGAATGNYNVTVSNACGSVNQNVAVTVNTPPNAGANGTLTICAGSTVTASQLFAQLGGTPNTGGTWSPAFAGAGVYTYTVAATAPCTGNATATVTVTAQPQPNAGTNGTLTICAGSTVTASQLFAQLGGTPNTGGTWSPAFAGAGVYTYTVAATAPCTGNATATVTVSEQAQPNAGSNGALSICSTAAAQSLFDQLGGTPNAGGTWSGPSTVVGGNYNPVTMEPGVYTYTVAATAPCTGNATATVTVTETATGTWYQDADGDGAGDPNVVLNQCDQPAGYVANNNDLCPNDGNKQSPGACGCGVADVPATYYADTDGDGFGAGPAIPGFTCNQPAGTVTDNTDNCPTLFGRIGDSCDDGNANTFNDVITANCVCQGTPAALDCNGVPNGPALPGTPCNDNNACTINDVFDANCNCAGTIQDTDSDGVCDANDPCPTQANVVPGQSCNDGNACTINDVVTANCGCAGTFQDTDSDGVCDASDNCPTVTGQIGSACDDGNANTINDQLNAACQCVGTPVGPGCDFNQVQIQVVNDAVSSLQWEVRAEGTGSLVANGAVNPPAGSYTQDICLPNGCYYLVVTDNGGDGITGGGYVLRLAAGARLIDNASNFSSGAVSQIANNEGFCLPLGADRLIVSSCDKLDWRPNQFVVANPNTAVSAQFGGPNAGTSGYQMWWYNPNGGYSFKRFQSHLTTNGLVASATRACNFAVNGWSGNQLQNNVLYNVKVRGRVAGTNLAWGPACRFVLNPLRAQCPLTKLNDIVGNQYLSCGQSRNWGSGNFVSARPVSRLNASGVGTQNANRYQFRFRLLDESVVTVRTSSTYHLQLNWSPNPLIPGNTYLVDVRASFDNGATWCTDFIQPSVDPWGDFCTLTINGAIGMAPENATSSMSENVRMALYPNPNAGDQLTLSLSAVEEGVETVSVDIFDAFGKRVAARTIAVQDGFVNTVVSLNGELADGLYVVSITAGTAAYTERLVIQK